MGIEIRTLMVLDDNRHDLSNHLVLCMFDAEEQEVVKILPGISTEPVAQQEQLAALKVAPVGFIVYAKNATVSDGVKVYGNGEMGGLTIEGDVRMNEPKIMLLAHYGKSGTHRDGVGPTADRKVNLTIGACIRVNALFDAHDWVIPFKDDYVMRNRPALKADGSIHLA